MDAPKPTPSEKMDKKAYSIEKDSKKYKLSISASSGYLDLQLETIGLFPNKIFSANLTKSDLEKISKLFKMNDSIEECLLNFYQFFDEEKYSFEEQEEKILLTVSPATLNIKDFQINLKLKEMNNDEKYNLVSIEIKNIIEENKLCKEKISDLEKKCDELAKSNELIVKKSQELEQKNLELEKKFKKIEKHCFKILKKEGKKVVNSWICPNKKIKFALKYNAKRDGCDTDIFHEKCDNLGKSLIVCRTTSGMTVGAYMTTNIEKKKGFKNDQNAFLFNLSNKIIKKNLKQKYDKAVYNYDDNSNFIKFGGCDCFRLAGNCLFNKNSYADICHCDTNFDCQSKNILNGGNGEAFQVDNFEVYQVLLD